MNQLLISKKNFVSVFKLGDFQCICLCFQYPYIPAHITKPKEHKRLYLVQLPEKGWDDYVETVLLISV